MKPCIPSRSRWPLYAGKLDGCQLNRALWDETGAIYDIIAGTFLAGRMEEDFGSLSPELLAVPLGGTL